MTVYDNSKGQICKMCSDKTITNAGLHALVRHGFVYTANLEPSIQKEFTEYLNSKKLLTWKGDEE